MVNKKNIGIVIVLFLFFIVFGYYCPINTIFGIPCPGCGMTRSLIAFVHFDFQTSFYRHALLIPTGICFLKCILSKDYKEREKILFYWAILMVIYYIIRMVLYFPNDPMEYNEKCILKMLIDNVI